MDYSSFTGFEPTTTTIVNTDVLGTGLLAGGLFAFLATIWIFCLAIAILSIVAMWKIFTKAGEEGWKSIIPIYNIIILFKISGLNPLLILVYLTAMIPFIGWIGSLVMTIILYVYLAKSFGKDGGFAVGLIFLSTIFLMILGFSHNIKYVGPGGVAPATEPNVVEPTPTDNNTDNQ